MADGYFLRQLNLSDMDAVARLQRLAFAERLPWLADLHTPEEDRWFFRERVFKSSDVWGALDHSALIGFIAFREGWIDQLYVLPEAQRHGVGSALLEIERSRFPRLCLWTFQRNQGARAFYEAMGFVLVSEADGSDNEQRETDAL